MPFGAYDLAKTLHVLLAIVAVGFNASYGVWIGRAARDPRHLPFALRGVKLLDDWIANPCYVGLLLTGAAMVWMSWSWRTFWIEASVALWLLAMALGVFAYTPTLRRQIEALERKGAASDEFRALSTRGAILGGVLGVIVVTIVVLMVTKPVL